MKVFDWLKIAATAVLIEIMLVAISIAEVFAWVCIQAERPGEIACQLHAESTGPAISAIFGALFMYLFTDRYCKKSTQNIQSKLRYALLLPSFYLLLDVAILLFYPINWLEHLPVLIAANAPKYAGALLAYFSWKEKMSRQPVFVPASLNEERKEKASISQ